MTRTKVQNSSLSYDSGSLAFRNRIINGAMEIAQRGTSFAAASGYTLDRFIFSIGGGGVVTITQSTDVPNNTFQNSLRVDVTTADTSVGTGDVVTIQQRIEGYNVRDLIGQTFTLSFWVKSPKTGVHCVSFRNSGVDRSYIMEYTVSAANTWEYKTITVNGGLITAGTWNWTNGTGLYVDFTLLTGTIYQTTAGSWQTGNFLGTSNQVNCMDNVNNDFFLTGVQLELGPVATPFERRPYGLEFSLCQRYYQTNVCSDGAMNNANTLFVTPVGFANSPMRTTPNVSLRSGTNAIHRPGIAFYNITAITETSTAAYLSLTISNNYGANLPGQLMPNAIAYSAEL
jgi:hypothetical protein